MNPKFTQAKKESKKKQKKKEEENEKRDKPMHNPWELTAPMLKAAVENYEKMKEAQKNAMTQEEQVELFREAFRRDMHIDEVMKEREKERQKKMTNNVEKSKQNVRIVKRQKPKATIKNKKEKNSEGDNDKKIDDQTQTVIEESDKSRKEEVTGSEWPASMKDEAGRWTVCFSCHAPASKVELARCRGCKRACYCDEQCQAADWNRHQDFCVARQAARVNRKQKSKEPLKFVPGMDIRKFLEAKGEEVYNKIMEHPLGFDNPVCPLECCN